MVPVSFVKTAGSYRVSGATINRQTCYYSGLQNYTLRLQYIIIRDLPTRLPSGSYMHRNGPNFRIGPGCDSCNSWLISLLNIYELNSSYKNINFTSSASPSAEKLSVVAGMFIVEVVVCKCMGEGEERGT